MLTLPEYMFSNFVYAGVHIVLLFLLWLCFTIISTLLGFSIRNCSCNRWNIQLILCAMSYSFLQIGFILYYIQLLLSLKRKTRIRVHQIWLKSHLSLAPFTDMLRHGRPEQTHLMTVTLFRPMKMAIAGLLLNCFARQSNNICPKR